jgi:hypothetical protein
MRLWAVKSNFISGQETSIEMVLINEMVSLFDFLKLCFILICNICIARCMYFCGFGFVLFCWCGFSSLLSRHILFINSVGVSFVDLHTLVDLRFLPPFIYEIPNQTQTLHFLLQYHPSSFLLSRKDVVCCWQTNESNKWIF